jgi:hypothetical protein
MLKKLMAGLGAAGLYVLPQRAWGSTIDKLLGAEYAATCNDGGIARAGSLYDEFVPLMENEIKGLDPSHMQTFAVAGYGMEGPNTFDRTQSLLELNYYLDKCGIDPNSVAPASDHLNRYMDAAREAFHKLGVEVPFFGHDLIDAAIITGLTVGGMIALSRYGKFKNLFHGYSSRP